MKIFNIMDYGAVPNIQKPQTQAITEAINEADKAFGTVYIPSGVYITGTLNLKGASIYLAKGAILKGSSNIDDYVFNGYMHNEMGKCLSLIYSIGNNDIKIYGEGAIDLNGHAFFDFSNREIPNSKVSLTDKQISQCTVTYNVRPTQPIFFYNCKNVSVQDISIVDAPCWTLTFVESQNIRIKHLSIWGNPNIPNNDGLHFCSCSDVLVNSCNIETADDCIALSCITDWNKPCQDIIVSDCNLKSYSKAIVIGYMHSIIKDVTISNCIIKQSNRGLCIMSSHKTGLVENVLFNNIIIDTQIRAGNWWGNGEPIFIMGTYHHNYTNEEPKRTFEKNVKNISFNSIYCTSENAIGLVGADNNIENVSFQNIFVQLKHSDNIAIKGRQFDLAPSEHMDVIPQDEKTYFLVSKGTCNTTMHNVRGIDADGCTSSIYQYLEE